MVGFPHDIKGQAIYAFVITMHDVENENTFQKEINDQIAKSIGAFARIDKIMVVPGLPKTRSGKIMRRILRKIAEGDTTNIGDISTLFNPEVVEEIISKHQKLK